MPFQGHPETIVCNGQGCPRDLVDVLVGRCYIAIQEKGVMQEPGGPGYNWWSALQEGLEYLVAPQKHTQGLGLYDWYITTPEGQGLFYE